MASTSSSGHLSEMTKTQEAVFVHEGNMLSKQEVSSSPPDSPQVKSETVPGFWKTLTNFPLISSSIDKYEDSKQKSSFLKMGLGVLEAGARVARMPFLAAADKVKKACPTQVAAFESKAVDCLHSFELRCPTMSRPADELADAMKSKASWRVERCVHGAMESRVGQLLVKTLDTSIKVMEDSVTTLLPEESDTESETTEGGKELEKIQRKRVIRMILTMPLWLPLRIMVCVVHKVRATLSNLEGRRDRKNKMFGSITKKVSVESRKMLSPKKRLHSNYFQRLMDFILHPISFTCGSGLKQKDIRLYCVPVSKDISPNKQGKQEKRKHDDISDEDEISDDDNSEVSDIREDLFNLDEYVSGEDPDYQPEVNASTDSLEYQEGDTESDIEPDQQEKGGQKDLEENKVKELENVQKDVIIIKKIQKTAVNGERKDGDLALFNGGKEVVSEKHMLTMPCTEIKNVAVLAPPKSTSTEAKKENIKESKNVKSKPNALNEANVQESKSLKAQPDTSNVANAQESKDVKVPQKSTNELKKENIPENKDPKVQQKSKSPSGGKKESMPHTSKKGKKNAGTFPHGDLKNFGPHSVSNM